MKLTRATFTYTTVQIPFFLLLALSPLLLGTVGCRGLLESAPVSPTAPLPQGSVAVEISSPHDGVSIAGSSVRLVASASADNPVGSISVLLDGSKVLHSPASAIDTRIPVAAGNHSITVQATDNIGNTAEKNVRFTVTAWRLDISIMAPLSDDTTLSPARVVVKASGSNHIASLQLLVDGREEKRTSAASVDTRVSLSHGRHVLTVRATDSESNSVEKALHFTVSEPRFAVISLMGTTDPEDGYFPFAGTLNSYWLDPHTGALSTSPITTFRSGGSFSQPFLLLKDEDAGLLFGFHGQDRNGPGDVGVFSIDKRSGTIGWPANDGATIDSPSADAAVLTANGQLLYATGVGCPPTVCNWTDAMGIGAWKVDRSKGMLSPVPGMPLATTEFPRGPAALSYDPRRQLLFATQAVFSRPSWTADIFTYQIDEASGALTLKSKKHVGVSPRLGPVHPSGKFLYAFTDSETVALQLEGNSPGGISSRSPMLPARLHIEPSGRFAIGTRAPREIALYRINQDTGALTQTTPSIPLPGNPHTVALDASGELIYVTNELNVSAFRLDKLEGTLEEIEGSPFRVGTEQHPEAAAVVIMSGQPVAD